jgi:methylthioribose-1-phosphate isomerase
MIARKCNGNRGIPLYYAVFIYFSHGRMGMNAIRYKNKRLFYIDQRFLPFKEVWRECKHIDNGYTTIKQLRVRGAPLIGVFAAYCICISLDNFSQEKNKFFDDLFKAIDYLESARPTAVNLVWSLKRIRKAASLKKNMSVVQIKNSILLEARAIHREDIRLCKQIAEHGVTLVKKGDRILTHCNTGFLATSGEGTALAIIYKAHRLKKDITVFADETRPLLQGSRLTAWELFKKRIPCFLITDSMAASLMRNKMIDKVFVGADRIAANGDVANKIGTYSLAILAYHHTIPFYVAAPSSTFDLSIKKGDTIPIEHRDMDEVRKVLGKVYIAPPDIPTCNPAFDITPYKLITAIISDRGIIYPPFRKNIKEFITNYKNPT